MKRTRIDDYQKIDKADDLDNLGNDKRKEKRATKKKATRRNRHYQKDLLRFFTKNLKD